MSDAAKALLTAALRLCGQVAMFWAAATGPALAHSGDATGFAVLTIRGDAVSYRLTPIGSGDSADAAALLRGKITISADGQPCELSASDGWDAHFRCPAAPQRLHLRDDLADVLGDRHHVVGMATWAGGSQSFDLSARQREATLLLVATTSEPTQGAGSFFLLGVEHIATGYDHLLFVLALVLCGGNLVALLKIITAFTIAHSLTLGAAALDWLTLPSTLVEAVIALSIAYVAFENLMPRYALSRRWLISFLFGLVHGFGFSSVLKEIGLPKGGELLALLNFNLGVEAGQIVAVLLVLPLLAWLKTTRWEQPAVRTVSFAVLLVGLGLFVDRALLSA